MRHPGSPPAPSTEADEALRSLPALVECVLCDGPPGPREAVERAMVPCNVRAHLGERFPVWRCPHCGSIHSAARVDLAAYYRDYPFHAAGAKPDPMLAFFHDRQLARLRRAGVTKDRSILDYGCGGGAFVDHLRARGFSRATGWDAFAERFHDERALLASYDVVIAQDVIEHDAHPRALLAKLAALVAPGGLLVIGTPNAAAVDLARADRDRHTLHQPYHTHLFSRRALEQAAAKLGLATVRYYRRQYSNTLFPGLNQPYALLYARAFDDTIDLAFDGRRRFSLRLVSPWAIVLALFGWLFSRELDVAFVFRAPR